MSGETRHVDYWTMARECRAYCLAESLRLVSFDDQDTRRIGFKTDLPESDPRCRTWSIRLVDVSRTANKRKGGFAGLSDDAMCALNQLLMNRDGRVKLAAELLK